ncbi:MAG TPA: Ppx/GppA phosphatase family protein [Streptosporangiaceae bacterium]|nr:Ppx/GppA phosphatase family protein [Streptosporangiaceae bacterium]
MRVAAIDCGTNSLRLLVADVDPAVGTLTDVDRRMEIVRLGQGVDATGRLAPAALARTLRALRSYEEIVEAAGASAVRMVATSATRDAANAADFVAGVREVLRVDPEVLSGDEEARLSFTGATTELAAAARPGVGGEGEGGGLAAAGPAAPPYLVADIGGGSTEFVLGDPPVVSGAVSVDIGCVRMTERHLRADPPTPAEVAAARADIGAALDVVAAKIAVADARTLVGLAGSVTTVAALALGLDAYDAGRIHHARIGAGQVQEQTARLLAMPQAERARLGVMHPGRVDVIGGGALVLEAIMTRFGFTEVLASEHDILDGIAWWLALGGSGASA